MAPAHESADQLFRFVFAAAATIKLLLAAILPLTGDEAYFVLWGRFPDYGYYDHGAMIGWWTALASLAGKSVLLLRLPAVLIPLIGAVLIRGLLRPVEPAKASLAATIFLLSPASLFNVLIMTDAPLLLFTLLSGVFAIRGVRSDRLHEWMLAGFFLGLAILTKYLAFLLGLAFAVCLLFFGGRRRFSKMLTVLAGAAPGLAVNLLWNFHHGWTNILFNVFTRNAELRFSPLSPLQFMVLTSLGIAGPVALYFLMRPSGEGRASWRETWAAMQEAGTHFALVAVAVPILVLLPIALWRPVGLHWMFSFYPFFFLVLAAKFDAARLWDQVRPTIIVAAGFTATALSLLALPVEAYRWHRSYGSIILGTHTDEVLAQLAPYEKEYTLVTPSYSQSAQLSFQTGRHVPVIGPGSFHGRQDDFITDFRLLDGRNMMVLSVRPRDAALTHTFFDQVEARDVIVRGARLSLVLGRGFRFEAYRDAVLRRVAIDYYRLPGWFARWSRPAPFVARYGLETIGQTPEIPAGPRASGAW